MLVLVLQKAKNKSLSLFLFPAQFNKAVNEGSVCGSGERLQRKGKRRWSTMGFVASAFVALILCLLAQASARGSTTEYPQDVPIRSLYGGQQEAHPELPWTAWETLPINSGLSKQGLLSMPTLSCAVSIKDGRLYSSKKKEKQSHEEKITLTSPFSPWSFILDLGVNEANRMVAAGADIIYVLTADNLMKISLSSSCDSGSVVHDKLLTSAFQWGADISSLSVAASSSLLFVCSKDRGLFTVPLAVTSDAPPMQIAELGSRTPLSELGFLSKS
jgi:hypothetical protein